ncbi:hypothetical protein SISSUDRAFT_1125402 [Sistotremastrum suecicum HHB10207 ss-3]|uniref:Glycosyltransferase family 25 protein n=1 Tax=Sistotremastrum suecicum HHB10207 ss-3 TaxID=1314776 RepID=A0A166HLH0_9AGAM|nr:hypothetical protein SISSUDRAFT_1125402 [Sistotremastrum suecicum HHB10207 ss-3]
MNMHININGGFRNRITRLSTILIALTLVTLLILSLSLASAFSQSAESSIFSIPLPLPLPLKNSFKSLLFPSNSSQSSSPPNESVNDNETEDENEDEPENDSDELAEGRRRRRLPPIYVISLPHRTDRRKNMERLRLALDIPLSPSSASFISSSSSPSPVSSDSSSLSSLEPSDILRSRSTGYTIQDMGSDRSKDSGSTVYDSPPNSDDSVIYATSNADLKHSILEKHERLVRHQRHKRLRRLRGPSTESLQRLDQFDEPNTGILGPRETLLLPEPDDLKTHETEADPPNEQDEAGGGGDEEAEWTYIPAIPSTSPQIDAIISHVRAYRLWLSSHSSPASSSTPSPSSASSTSFTSASSTSRTDENGPVEFPRYGYANTSLWPYTPLPQLPNSNTNTNSNSKYSKEQEEPLTCAINDTIPSYKPTMKHYRILSKGMIACWLSHLNTLNLIARHFQNHNQTQVLKNGSKRKRTRGDAAIVLEDDVDMESDIVEIVYAVLDNVPPNWDIIFLGTSSPLPLPLPNFALSNFANAKSSIQATAGPPNHLNPQYTPPPTPREI